MKDLSKSQRAADILFITNSRSFFSLWGQRSGQFKTKDIFIHKRGTYWISNEKKIYAFKKRPTHTRFIMVLTRTGERPAFFQVAILFHPDPSAGKESFI